METLPSAPWYRQLRKFVVPESVFGVGAAGLVGRFAANIRMRKAFVVTDPGVIALGWTARVVESLRQAGVDAAVFAEVSPNPRDHEVMRGAEVYRAERCDGIVAVGGGSPMDLAKAVGIVCSNGRHVLAFAGVDQVEKPGPPLICLPTTAGTGAEVSQFAIITDTARRVKIAIVSKTVIPDAALLDPEMTTTMSPELTAFTGLDTLTHAVEAYVSNASSLLTDHHALQAIRLVRENLLAAIKAPLDLDARSGMLLASLHAGMAFSNAILGAVHAMAHSLGGYLDLPHGLCNAILLDTVMEYNFAAAPKRFAAIGQALGAEISPDMEEEAVKQSVLSATRALKAAAGVRRNLASLGVTPDLLEELANKARQDPCLLTNPAEASALDLRHLFESACGVC